MESRGKIDIALQWIIYEPRPGNTIWLHQLIGIIKENHIQFTSNLGLSSNKQHYAMHVLRYKPWQHKYKYSTHTPRRKQRTRYHRGRRNIKLPVNSSNNLKTVINLSDRELSEHGPEYVPTPTSVNKTELITDIKQWGRRIR